MNNAKDKPRVLIVDDEPIVLETFKVIFAGHFKVLTAGCGLDALKRIAKNSINLVFLDFSLPDMDGLQVLAKIREYNNNLPIIMVTGYDNQDIVREGRQLGAIDYIDKPFDIEQVLNMAYKTLNKK